jgi:hypothetical protein
VKPGIPGLRWQHACRFLNYAAWHDEGVGEIVPEAVRVVRESRLPNRTVAMFTNIVCLTHC